MCISRQVSDLRYISKTELNRTDATELNTLTNHAPKEATEYFTLYTFMAPEHR
jgi:hypothetical protein